MNKILKFLKFIVPVAIIYFIYNINKLVALILILVILAFLIMYYRYFFNYMKGSKLYSSGDFEGAMESFRKACKVGSCPDNIRHSYAFLLLKNKHLDEAEKALNELMKKNLKQNTKYSVRMTYALLVWKKGDLNKAIEILEQVYKEFKCTTLYENLGYLLVLNKDYDKALKINREAYEYNSSSKTICDNLGEAYYYIGEYDKAYEVYNDLVNNGAKFIEAFYHFGLVLAKLDRKEEALTNLNKALEFKESYLSEVNHNTVRKAIETLQNQ